MQEVAVVNLMADISKVVISSNNSISHMVVVISLKEVINNSSTDREGTVKMSGTVVPPKPNRRINKVSFSRVHLKQRMELLPPPHRCRSGKLQQHRMVNNITTTNGRERQRGKNPQECCKKKIEVSKKRLAFPLSIRFMSSLCLT
mmetsp:Transcript_101062/g.205043  ORF Transcript_101062/g.205043 Transcript_101062/m.205043 type:complete len:145 (-) Transcript_101062:1456-1890(-)